MRGCDASECIEVHAIGRELPVIAFVVGPRPNLQMIGIDAQAVVAPVRTTSSNVSTSRWVIIYQLDKLGSAKYGARVK